MRIGIFGTGALGGFYGGILVKNGADVVFIARGKTLEVIRKQGLGIKSVKYGEFTVPVKATDNPDAAGKVDILLLCVKSYDTAKVAPLLLPMLKETSVVISVQNGIDNEEILAEVLGAERVLGGVAFVGAYVISPGVVVHEAAGLLEIGELTRKKTERVERVVSFLNAYGIESRVSRDILYALWKKLLWNVAFNPYSVVTRTTVGQMLTCKEAREILVSVMQECLEVARAWGVKLKESHIEKYLKVTPGLSDYKTSMLLDFERGKPLEIEGITGALIKKAEAKKLNVPFNRCIYNTVKFLVKMRDGLKS
ncbi:MAG: 2-dehydropantoate 2-reductase [Candidatus Desulfofervidaceae bacterium]|nr:2-dehydropantoate 2-reductase [Candidatus Desulfofervidaceae bacterium]